MGCGRPRPLALGAASPEGGGGPGDCRSPAPPLTLSCLLPLAQGEPPCAPAGEAAHTPDPGTRQPANHVSSSSMKTIADIPLADADRRAIEEASGLLRERYPIERIVLYGSKAKGTDTSESDIDLLLVTTVPLSWRDRDAITEALFDIQLAHDVVISTLVVPRSEWIDGVYAVLPIHAEIERHGVAA
jgi:uncharacterized protein